MRKVTLGIALASTALAAPAIARDGEWYVGVEGGVSLPEDQDYETNGLDDAYESEADLGFDVDGIIGYDFGMFRLEGEVAYKEFEYDELTTVNGALVDPVATGTPTTATTTGNFDINGNINVLSFMLNGLLDFGEDDGVQGFVGGGVGVARTEIDQEFGDTFLDDSDTGFAWQALAGVRAPISKDWDVGLKYRFFNVEDISMVDVLGRDIDTDLRSHSILGSFIYNFGGAEEVPPPPPVAAPVAPPVTTPPPPPAPVCKTSPYLVFFDWDESVLTAEARGILDNAVNDYANCGTATVMLSGYTDTSGSAEYNIGLSERRNESVSSYMISKGVPAGVIDAKAYGETDLRVQTPDGVRELENRRVKIQYGPGSGM